MKKIIIMGILNITPDSFSDGGLYFQSPKKALKRAVEIYEEGADIIDIGGESTRPGSVEVAAGEQIARVVPVIKAIKAHFAGTKLLISIDTNKSEVANAAIACGAGMVNSLGGMSSDPDLAEVVASTGCKFTIYHIKGKPITMQSGDIQYQDVIEEISNFFTLQIQTGIEKGIQRNQFIIDPGIGFGKTLAQNLEIIRRLREFKGFNLPILIGVSRKSHLGMLLQNKLGLHTIPSPTERLEAALAETAVAITNGATIIRTHDVMQTKKFTTILEELY